MKSKPKSNVSRPATKLVEFSQAGLEAAMPSAKDYFVSDPRTDGLFLKVTPNGKKVFVLRYRSRAQRQRKLNIGNFPALSVSAARKIAKTHWASIYEGGDPAASRDEEKNLVTVKDLAVRYLEIRERSQLKTTTFKEYRSAIMTRIVPEIGMMPLRDLGRRHVEHLHSSMSASPVRANRVISILKAMLYKAEDWELIPRGSNPASRLRLNKEDPKRHYFTDTEQVAIFRAIGLLRNRMLKSASAFDAIQMLFFTGCRTNEVLKLKWTDVDIAGRTISLHDTKTGEARLPIPDQAVDFLQSIAAAKTSQWVFPGANRDQPLKGLVRPWLEVRKLANLPDANIKDIRHTVGTFVAKEGGLYSAQAILRHSSPQTTMRYAHPFEETIRQHQSLAIGQIANNMEVGLSKSKQRRRISKRTQRPKVDTDAR